MEQWKDIPGFESRYQVSVKGQIRSKDFSFDTGNNIITRKGRVIKAQPTGGSGRYLRVTLSDRKRVMVHRCVALAFIGPSPSAKHTVNHIDGNPHNNTVGNLEWATCSEQIYHAKHVIKTWPTGSKHGRAKITEDKVIAIYKAEGTLANIANTFGISVSTVSRIKLRSLWANTTKMLPDTEKRRPGRIKGVSPAKNHQ